MPDVFGHFIERRMPVDFGFRRFEHHALLGGITRGDRGRGHDPDRQAFAATGVDVARSMQRHGGIARMQRADMLMREVQSEDLVLLKGSRGMRMETMLEML